MPSMKKLLQAIIESDLSSWIKNAIGVAVVLVLLKMAGIQVDAYVDQALRTVFELNPHMKNMLVSVFGVLVSLPIVVWYKNLMKSALRTIPDAEIERFMSMAVLLGVTGGMVSIPVLWLVGALMGLTPSELASTIRDSIYGSKD